MVDASKIIPFPQTRSGGTAQLLPCAEHESIRNLLVLFERLAEEMQALDRVVDRLCEIYLGAPPEAERDHLLAELAGAQERLRNWTSQRNP
jgi:hypothetical protein